MSAAVIQIRRDGPRLFARGSWWWAAHPLAWGVGSTPDAALGMWRRLVKK